MAQFGLIGFPLTHSFSKAYFEKKWLHMNLQHEYSLFELPDVTDLKKFLNQRGSVVGFNVTIPYKQAIMPLLDELDPAARAIGAVNVVHLEDGKWKGYNTDYIGFLDSLKSFILPENPAALILGNGGASQAVQYALMMLKTSYQIVSRRKSLDSILYEELNESLLRDYTLIINTTPLGMYPKVDLCPNVPYQFLSPEHYLYDLIYNPEETLFLKKGKEKGAAIKNGLEMLHLQADAAWDIWQTSL